MSTSDAVWLTEADVVATIDLPTAITAVSEAVAAGETERAATLPKTAISWDGGHTLHALGGRLERDGLAIVGTKTWAHTAGGATPLLQLWDAHSGALLAIVEAFALGQLRTASSSAVATDRLADPEAHVMAMIGTGRQSLAQVAAVAAVRRLTAVRVFSPTVENRRAFAERVAAALPSVEVTATDDVTSAVAGADVITTATRSRDPIIFAADLAPGAHVNALGAITPERAELDRSVVSAAGLVVSDSPEVAQQLSGEVAGCSISSLGAVVTGAVDRPAGISVFKAMGLGLADIAVGHELLRRAAAAGRGRPLPQPTRATPDLFAS